MKYLLSIRSRKKLILEGYDILIHLVAIVHQTIKIPEEQYFKINRDLVC